MNTTALVLVFAAVTLAVHYLLARAIGSEAASLGFNKTRWTIFILIGGIPALIVYRAERNAARRRTAADEPTKATRTPATSHKTEDPEQ